MITERFRRLSGSTLILVLVIVLLILGITGSLTALLVADAKVLAESGDRLKAFYLAETGLQNSKWEFGESADSQNDGKGKVTGSNSDGTYTVTAEDLGS